MPSRAGVDHIFTRGKNRLGEKARNFWRFISVRDWPQKSPESTEQTEMALKGDGEEWLVFVARMAVECSSRE
jgi:hypothetical protein